MYCFPRIVVSIWLHLSVCSPCYDPYVKRLKIASTLMDFADCLVKILDSPLTYMQAVTIWRGMNEALQRERIEFKTFFKQIRKNL